MTKPVVAYMVSAYPARSHTFIRREIALLEQLGFTVQRYSQRRCDRKELLDATDEKEYQATFAVQPFSLGAIITCHVSTFLNSPLQYFKTFLGAIKFCPPGALGVIYSMGYFFQGMILVEPLRRDRVEKMHIHFANSGMYLGVVACEYLGLPWSVSVHGRSDFDYPGATALPKILEKGEFLRCISRYGKSQVMRQTRAELWDKILLSYCGLPDQYLDKTHRVASHEHENKVTTLLSVGRLSAEKGQFLLLDLASKLKALGHKIIIQIVGDGPDRARLEARARQLGVAEICCFVGALAESDVLEYMRRADIFVCPSLMEGLPQVLMEAMAVRLPVVAPALAGIPELVRDKETGMLFITGDSDSLLMAVCQLLEAPQLAEFCVNNAYRLLEDEFLLSKTIIPLADQLVRRVE